MLLDRVKICNKCSIKLTIYNTRTSSYDGHHNTCIDCEKKNERESHIRNRKSVIQKLGNCCVCCGIYDYDLLTIDHKLGGGKKEKKNISTRRFISKIDKLPVNELLEIFQCLCYNCNCCLGCWGICQHKLPNFTETNRKGQSFYERGKSSILNTIRALQLKIETILAYGNCCYECGEDKILFLMLDHINNNGSLDRKKFGLTNEFYSYLRKLGYPGKGIQLQVLCYNCNLSKEMNLRKTDNIRIGTNESYSKIEYSISKELFENIKNISINLIKSIYPLVNNKYFEDGRKTSKVIDELTKSQIYEEYASKKYKNSVIAAKFDVSNALVIKIGKQYNK